MASILRFCLLCLVAFFVGCGEGSTPVEPPQSSTAELIKSDLQMVAETGRMGSEMMSIEQNLIKLADEEPAKAEEVSQDFEELKGLSGPRAKAKAQEIIQKL